MSIATHPTGSPADLAACDREPIHVPGSIQPHGFLLAVAEETGRIHYASDNCATALGQPVAALLGARIAQAIGERAADSLRTAASDPLFSRRAVYVDQLPPRLGTDARGFVLVAHRHRGMTIVEGERQDSGASPLPAAHNLLEGFLLQMEGAESLPALGQLAAAETRRITGFDRALVYQFDSDWNGVVIAEDRNDVLPSYLDLRFPASDIPRQARELYRLNRLRLIARADYEPVAIRAQPGAEPLDLTLSTLRSVSPVHLEYMRNMGTGSSMSISIMRSGVLWGLISCHSRAPRTVPFEVRSACDLLGQVLSLQLSAREQAATLAHRMRLQSLLSPMIATLTRHERFADGIAVGGDHLLRIVGAHGAAVVADDTIALYGTTPTESQVRALVAWLASRPDEEAFATSSLARLLPEAAAYAPVASGLLALSISRLRRNHVLWFRREIVETVTWGGDPTKPATTEGPGAPRLHPRKSFETWKEIVRGRSAPWLQPEIDTAREFRIAVIDIVLQGAERLAQLTEDLTRTNRELENFSYTVSHDLRAPFRHIRAYAELLKSDKGHLLDDEGRSFLEFVLSGASYAGKLVDNILAFSQMGRTELQISTVSLDDLAWDVIDDLKVDLSSRRVEWDVDPLPTVEGDAAMLRTVLQNLLENAVKYTRDRPVTRIAVAARTTPAEHVVSVRDNGVGFDDQYKDKLFGMFQRLHRWEEFEGTGIGLASVRRIVARHGGRVWAEGKVGEGATFSFALPKSPIVSNTLYA